MRSFEVLDHTADVGLLAWGDTLPELLTACAEGMFSILLGPESIEEREEVGIEVGAEDVEELVHTWLRELLFHFDVENLALGRFAVQEAEPTRLRAVCHGETLDPSRHTAQVEIKAVTYHEFRVEQNDEGWTAEVLFDI
jgi:SHS2 domain-containing protein